MSAVSKKLIPSSRARFTNGRASFSSKTHARHLVEPYVIIPKQIRETCKPLLPSRTYGMPLFFIPSTTEIFPVLVELIGVSQVYVFKRRMDLEKHESCCCRFCFSIELINNLFFSFFSPASAICFVAS